MTPSLNVTVRLSPIVPSWLASSRVPWKVAATALSIFSEPLLTSSEVSPYCVSCTFETSSARSYAPDGTVSPRLRLPPVGAKFVSAQVIGSRTVAPSTDTFHLSVAVLPAPVAVTSPVVDNVPLPLGMLSVSALICTSSPAVPSAPESWTVAGSAMVPQLVFCQVPLTSRFPIGDPSTVSDAVMCVGNSWPPTVVVETQSTCATAVWLVGVPVEL